MKTNEIYRVQRCVVAVAVVVVERNTQTVITILQHTIQRAHTNSPSFIIHIGPQLLFIVVASQFNENNKVPNATEQIFIDLRSLYAIFVQLFLFYPLGLCLLFAGVGVVVIMRLVPCIFRLGNICDKNMLCMQYISADFKPITREKRRNRDRENDRKNDRENDSE